MLTDDRTSEAGTGVPLQFKPNEKLKTVPLLERESLFEGDSFLNFTEIALPPASPPVIFEIWFPQPVMAEKATA